MVKWQIINGNLQILFEGASDLKQFVDTVIRPSAEILGLEVEIRKAEKKTRKLGKTIRL